MSGDRRVGWGGAKCQGAHRALLVADDLHRVGPDLGRGATGLALVLGEVPAEEEEGVERDLKLRRHAHDHRPCDVR